MFKGLAWKRVKSLANYLFVDWIIQDAQIMKTAS
ncbi:hypothetical protein AusDCA_2506 [Desulfitobacterium sp. AusDCA]